MCFRLRFSYQKGRVWIPFTVLTPVTFVCLSQARTGIFQSHLSLSFSCVECVQVRLEVLFVLLILVKLLTITA